MVFHVSLYICPSRFILKSHELIPELKKKLVVLNVLIMDIVTNLYFKIG